MEDDFELIQQSDAKKEILVWEGVPITSFLLILPFSGSFSDLFSAQ